MEESNVQVQPSYILFNLSFVEVRSCDRRLSMFLLVFALV